MPSLPNCAILETSYNLVYYSRIGYVNSTMILQLIQLLCLEHLFSPARYLFENILTILVDRVIKLRSSLFLLARHANLWSASRQSLVFWGNEVKLSLSCPFAIFLMWWGFKRVKKNTQNSVYLSYLFHKARTRTEYSKKEIAFLKWPISWNGLKFVSKESGIWTFIGYCTPQ